MLESLVEFSRKISELAPIWTQGAGSNISEKVTENTLWIKASGKRLDEVSDSDGLVQINFETLKLHLIENAKAPFVERESNYSNSIAASQLVNTNNLRASMESGFHALSMQKWVLHFHSLPAILMAHKWKQINTITNDFFKKHELKFVKLVKPGWELSLEFMDIAEGLYILDNHGIVISSDDQDILTKWNKIENEFLSLHEYTDLLQLKKDVSSKTSRDWKIFNTGPVKFFYPDMAIYFNKLKPYLEKAAGSAFTLRDDAPKDLKEVWWATQILNKSEPNLEEIPIQMTSEITQLPTEKIRLSILESKDEK